MEQQQQPKGPDLVRKLLGKNTDEGEMLGERRPSSGGNDALRLRWVKRFDDEDEGGGSVRGREREGERGGERDKDGRRGGRQDKPLGGAKSNSTDPDSLADRRQGGRKAGGSKKLRHEKHGHLEESGEVIDVKEDALRRLMGARAVLAASQERWKRAMGRVERQEGEGEGEGGAPAGR